MRILIGIVLIVYNFYCFICLIKHASCSFSILICIAKSHDSFFIHTNMWYCYGNPTIIDVYFLLIAHPIQLHIGVHLLWHCLWNPRNPHKFSRKSMEIYINLRKSMESIRNLRKSIEICKIQGNPLISYRILPRCGPLGYRVQRVNACQARPFLSKRRGGSPD